MGIRLRKISGLQLAPRQIMLGEQAEPDVRKAGLDLSHCANLDSVLSMVQPVLILAMGIIIGGMLLATLMPMVSLLEQL